VQDWFDQGNTLLLKDRPMPIRLLSDDSSHRNARRFNSYDDFEEMELHSTILIDRQGRVHWARSGGAPFMELDFLLGEIDRLNGDLLARNSHSAKAK
jgi:hypothetical protein